MALDVYVGTMTRFYRREWENVVQRMSREQGLQYNMIYAGGEPELPPPADEIRQGVASWYESVTNGLKSQGVGTVAWDEGDHVPYFTDRPSWEGYRALLVWAAHAEHPEMALPENVPTSWVDDPAFEKSVESDFHSRYQSILKPEMWIPAEFNFVFEGPTLVSDNGCVGSVFALKQELDELYEATAEKLVAWEQHDKPSPPPELPPKTGFWARVFGGKPAASVQAEPALTDAAKFGINVFREMADKACENRLPMLLDY